MAGLLHVRDEQLTTVHGGASSAATANVRVLNTVVLNTITGASLAANRITLPAGTYDIFGAAPAFDVTQHRLSLYNISDSAIEIVGQSGNWVGISDATVEIAKVRGRITITAEKIFELRHYTTGAVSTNGLGTAMSDGLTEVYADLRVFDAAAAAAGGLSGIATLEYQSLLLDI